MISKGFYFSSKIEKNKGDRDFNNQEGLLLLIDFEKPFVTSHAKTYNNGFPLNGQIPTANQRVALFFQRFVKCFPTLFTNTSNG